VNTYTGVTTVNGGNLILSLGGGTGVLADTAITGLATSSGSVAVSFECGRRQSCGRAVHDY
jgi:hypothetical protein